MFQTLLKLITILLFDCTLGKAFESQFYKRDIYRKNSREMQRAKEMLWSNQAIFYTNPLLSETNNSSAFKRFSVKIPNDVPASIIKQRSVPNDVPASIIKQRSVPNEAPASIILQLSVPNDGPAHFKQLSVPMTAPQAISAATATTTVIKTPVHTKTTATTKVILLKFDNCLFASCQECG